MTTLGSAISKSLLTQLPNAMATKFNVSETEAREFMAEFLAAQFGSSKGAKRNVVKGTNGKGPQAPYIVFSNANRDAVKKANPSYKLPDIGKELGARWRGLSEEEKAKWVAKAASINAANGLSPKTAATSPAQSSLSMTATTQVVTTPVKKSAVRSVKKVAAGDN